MWIQGYKIQKNVLPPYHVQQIVRQLIFTLADNYGIPCEGSIHSEACYLNVNGKIISFRNHPGRNFDVEIQLSDFSTWEECEKYFVNNILGVVENEI